MKVWNHESVHISMQFRYIHILMLYAARESNFYVYS